MKPIILPFPLVAYALHFEKPIGKSQHYTGSVKSPLILRRLRDHQMGNGAKLVKEAAKRGIGFWLTKMQPIGNRSGEETLKAARWAARKCPICDSPFGDPDKTAENGWFPPVSPFVAVGLDHPTSSRTPAKW